MTPHDLVAAVVVTVLAGVAAVAAWVVAMVSDPVLVGGLCDGALLVSIVGVIGTLLARRDGKAARDVAESIHHQVAVNGTLDEPTLRDRVADLQASHDATNHALADHIVIGRQALGEVRKQVARVARDIKRMQEDS